MTIPRDFLLALLRGTRDQPVDSAELNDALRITDEAFESFLKQALSEGLLKERNGLLEASLEQRMDMAVKAIRAGADLERVSRALGWLEFEEIVAYTFEANSYRVSKRFRFSAKGRKWEIDVLARRKPWVVCAECKHWSKGLGNMTARRIVKTHLEKVEVLSGNVVDLRDRLGLEDWGRAIFVPITLSLQPARNQFYRRMPIVSVFKLPSFLSEFEGQIDWLASFDVELPPSKPRLTQTYLKR